MKIGPTIDASIHIKPISIHSRSPLLTKFLSLDVGEGFQVDEVDRGTPSNMANRLQRTTDRKFQINKLGPLSFMVTRVK